MSTLNKQQINILKCKTRMKTEETLSDETFKDGIQKVADLGPRRPALKLAC